MKKSACIHDDSQNITNIVENDNSIKGLEGSILSHQTPTIAHTLTRTGTTWYVDKHDGTGNHRLGRWYYIPKDFVVTRIMTNQMTFEWQHYTEQQAEVDVQVPVGGIFNVMVDMPNCEGVTVSLATSVPLMLHVTKVYLTAVSTISEIILLG